MSTQTLTYNQYNTTNSAIRLSLAVFLLLSFVALLLQLQPFFIA